MRTRKRRADSEVAFADCAGTEASNASFLKSVIEDKSVDKSVIEDKSVSEACAIFFSVTASTVVESRRWLSPWLEEGLVCVCASGRTTSESRYIF